MKITVELNTQEVLGKLIKRRRLAKTLDQIDVAKAACISQSTYSRIEAGRTGVTPEQLWLVAACLDTLPSALWLEIETIESAQNK